MSELYFDLLEAEELDAGNAVFRLEIERDRLSRAFEERVLRLRLRTTPGKLDDLRKEVAVLAALDNHVKLRHLHEFRLRLLMFFDKKSAFISLCDEKMKESRGKARKNGKNGRKTVFSPSRNNPA